VFTIEPEHDVSNNKRSIENENTKFPDTKHMLLVAKYYVQKIQ
jgi:hypothetical protein